MRLYDTAENHEASLKFEDGKLVMKTKIFNDPQLEAAQKLRNANAVVSGQKAKLQPDGAEVIYAIHVNQTEWNLFFKKRRSLHRQLHSKDQVTREKAAKRLLALKPEWFVQVPNRAKVFT